VHIVLELLVALATATEPSVLVAGVAAVLLVAAIATVVVAERELTVGARARAHREAMSTLPAPAHPDTAGRPRTRAPAGVIPAT